MVKGKSQETSAEVEAEAEDTSMNAVVTPLGNSRSDADGSTVAEAAPAVPKFEGKTVSGNGRVDY